MDKLKELFERHGYTYEEDEDGSFRTDAPEEFVVRVGEDGTLYDGDTNYLWPQFDKDE